MCADDEQVDLARELHEHLGGQADLDAALDVSGRRLRAPQGLLGVQAVGLDRHGNVHAHRVKRPVAGCDDVNRTDPGTDPTCHLPCRLEGILCGVVAVIAGADQHERPAPRRVALGRDGNRAIGVADHRTGVVADHQAPERTAAARPDDDEIGVMALGGDAQAVGNRSRGDRLAARLHLA